MDLQPTLENSVVFIRPLNESDFEELYQVAKDPLIWEQHPNGRERYKKEIFSAFFKESIESKGALVIIDKENNNIIGSSRFKNTLTENAIEIGWSFLSREYWGGIYNKSVKKLMMGYAFEYVENVIYYINKTNIRSQKAVEKIGGKILTDTQFDHLLNKNKDAYTYIINKHQKNKI